MADRHYELETESLSLTEGEQDRGVVLLRVLIHRPLPSFICVYQIQMYLYPYLSILPPSPINPASAPHTYPTLLLLTCRLALDALGPLFPTGDKRDTYRPELGGGGPSLPQTFTEITAGWKEWVIQELRGPGVVGRDGTFPGSPCQANSQIHFSPRHQ